MRKADSHSSEVQLSESLACAQPDAGVKRPTLGSRMVEDKTRQGVGQWLPTFFDLGPLLFCWRASGATDTFLNLADRPTLYSRKRRLSDFLSLEEILKILMRFCG